MSPNLITWMLVLVVSALVVSYALVKFVEWVMRWDGPEDES